MSKAKVLALAIVAVIFCSLIAFAQGADEKKEPTMEEKTTVGLLRNGIKDLDMVISSLR